MKPQPSSEGEHETGDFRSDEIDASQVDDIEETQDSIRDISSAKSKQDEIEIFDETFESQPGEEGLEDQTQVVDESRQTEQNLEFTLASRRPPAGGRDSRNESETSPDSGTGQTLGRYEIKRLLGEGAFGQVFEAHDPQLDRRVAIKVAKSIGSRTQLDRFLREARAAAQLRHPNIIPVYEFGEVEHENTIVYEFVRGETLKSLIRRKKKLPVDESLEIVRQIADGLDYAHRQGIIHRDMKPDNILVGSDNHPHIADFGCARTLNDDTSLTVDGSILGTPMYMSPEQASGRSNQADGRTDIWSLGVMLYEMVSGEKPFAGTLHDLLFWICNHDPKPLRKIDPAISPDIETICSRCLSREPENRFNTAGELADEIERFQRGEPIRSRPIGVLGRTWKWAKRNQAVASLLAAVVLTMLIGTVVSTSFAFQAWREQRNRAFAQMNAIETSEGSALPGIFESLQPFRSTILPRLKQQLEELESDSDAANPAKTQRLRMAILQLETDPQLRSQLADQMVDDLLVADAGEFFVCRDCLQFRASSLKESLWDKALNRGGSYAGGERFRAGAALALYDSESPHWSEMAPDLSNFLTSFNPIEMARWLPSLAPIRESLKQPLVETFRNNADMSDTAAERSAMILARLFPDQTRFLVGLIPAANVKQIPHLTRSLAVSKEDAIRRLLNHQASLAQQTSGDAETVQSLSNVQIALIQLGESKPWDRFQTSTDPSVAFDVIERLGPAGTPPHLVMQRLDRWEDLHSDELSGVLLTLGQFPVFETVKMNRKPLLLKIFSQHSDARVHSSALWLLDHWGFQSDRKSAETALRRALPEPDKNWHVDLAGNTFALFGPVKSYEMGLSKNMTAISDFDGSDIVDEPAHRKQIPRRFGICIHETTIEQFEAFEVDRIQYLQQRLEELDPKDARAKKKLELKIKQIERVQKGRGEKDKIQPIGNVDFFMALAFCRWLSEQQQTEYVVPSVDKLQTIYDEGKDIAITAEMLLQTGYRLPTATEWEYASRGPTQTVFWWGHSTELADRYAWYATNSDAQLQPVGRLKPGWGGLFDISGNVSEWCLDWYREEIPKLPEDIERGFYLDFGPEFAQHRNLDREFRGGSFLDEVFELRPTNRFSTRPILGYPRLGFRLTRTYESD